MSPVGQPIIEGTIPIDTTPSRLGLPPPIRRGTGSSHSTIPTGTTRHPSVTPPLPPSSIPVHSPGALQATTSHTPPPGTPPLVADGETNSPVEEAPPSTPPSGLNRTSIPEHFGQKNDPPSYLTARLQHDVATLHDKFKVLEKKVELYSAQSQAELAVERADMGVTFGKMILDSEDRCRHDVKEFREEVSEKFRFLFRVLDNLNQVAERLDTQQGERPPARPSGGVTPTSQRLPGNRSGVPTAARGGDI